MSREVGQIVHYISPQSGVHYAAVITDVRDAAILKCDLYIFPCRDSIGGMFLPDIWFSERNLEPGTWHWLEKR